MASSSSSPPPPLLLPPPESTHPQPQISPSPQKKTQPLPWTHQETFNLIQAYQEKWYSLKKGQLKASQWEEVAITVAARCGFDEPSKSATQCRHKIEKLRKRYRAERLKPYPNSWQYFDLMDRMERGPLPISAHPVAMVKCQQNSNSISNLNSTAADHQRYYYDNNTDSDEVDAVSYMDMRKNKSKSINHIVRGEMGLMCMNGNENVNVVDHRNVNRMVKDRNFNILDQKDRNFDVMKGIRNPMNEKRKAYFGNVAIEDDDEDDDVEEEVNEEEDEENEGSVGGSELAAEIRGFAERFMRMENKKIEMMKETERYRMEMEKRRMEMILENQRNLIDTINRVVGSHKKVKVAQEF
ncbi:PREDICTED: uncharacterized protein LOC109207705 [Nicotiana attenuata]|uniref:Myb-like domain-containing protein n=1 Tax=Nicotiana attenuata TaxID=49451 RepID=A0A314KTX8_NICAT|nr:PREDICTED: uncharacterized protein LOC109207705 [Nicotiana attenuata]OIT32164.1 hypothetical protein A4A49_38327 [Nicotiana attenuata]